MIYHERLDDRSADWHQQRLAILVASKSFYHEIKPVLDTTNVGNGTLTITIGPHDGALGSVGLLSGYNIRGTLSLAGYASTSNDMAGGMLPLEELNHLLVKIKLDAGYHDRTSPSLKPSELFEQFVNKVIRAANLKSMAIVIPQRKLSPLASADIINGAFYVGTGLAVRKVIDIMIGKSPACALYVEALNKCAESETAPPVITVQKARALIQDAAVWHHVALRKDHVKKDELWFIRSLKGARSYTLTRPSSDDQ